MSIVNKRELSDLFDVTPQTLTTWQKNGLPITIDGSNGIENRYSTRAVIDWFVERELQKRVRPTSGADDDDYFQDSETELARLRHHQANNQKLDEEETIRRLLDSDEVATAMLEVDNIIKSHLLNQLPRLVAEAAIQGSTFVECKQLATEIIHEALENLSKRGDDYPIGNSTEAAASL